MGNGGSGAIPIANYNTVPTKSYETSNIALYKGYNAVYSNSKQQVFFVYDPNFVSGSTYAWDYRLTWFHTGNTGFTTWYVIFNGKNTRTQFGTVIDKITNKSQVIEIWFYLKNVTNANGTKDANFWDNTIMWTDDTTSSRAMSFNQPSVSSSFNAYYSRNLFNCQYMYILDNTINTPKWTACTLFYDAVKSACRRLIVCEFRDNSGKPVNTNILSSPGLTLTFIKTYTSELVSLFIWAEIFYYEYTGLLFTIPKPNHKNKTGSNWTTLSIVDDTWAMTSSDIGGEPIGIIHDISYVYVANNASNTISRISINDATDVCYNWITTDLYGPFGLAIDNNRNLYVSNYGPLYSNTGDISGTNTICKFSISDAGVPTLVNPSWASGLGGPAALVCDSSYIFVTELGTSQDGIFTGTSMRAISLSDPSVNIQAVNDLSGPIGITIDLSYNIIYVLNNNSNYISKIDISNQTSDNEWLYINKPLAIDIDTSRRILIVTHINTNNEYCVSTVDIVDISIKDSSIKDSGIFGVSIYNSYLYISNIMSNNIERISFGSISSETDTIISNICFTENTPILTDQGYIPICKIYPNIHTIRNKKIVDVTKSTTLDDYLVCFDKDSIVNGYPTEKTIISKDHKVFYEGKMKEAYTFLDKFENVYKVEYNGEMLYNILMEEHTCIRANHLICETLDPKNFIAKLYTNQCKYSNEEKRRIINILNDSVQKKDHKRFKQITKNIK